MKETHPFQLWLIASTEKICICYSSPLAYWSNVIMEKFLRKNVLLRHLLCLCAWWRYAININIFTSVCPCKNYSNWYWGNILIQLILRSIILSTIFEIFSRSPLAQNSKKHLIKEYLDWTRPGQWGKRTFFRHRLYVWTS